MKDFVRVQVLKVANILSGSRFYAMLVLGVLPAAGAVLHRDVVAREFHLPF